MFIILTKAQARRIRGKTGPLSALDPVALKNGTEWVLPARVLADPAHAMLHNALKARAKRAVAKSEFPEPEQIRGE